MRIEAGVATDIGRVRDGNEDSYLVEPPLYAVADGMGGHRGGEVASQLALETLEERFAAQEGSLADQVRAANRAVFERSASDRKVTGMGTTLTAALVAGGSAHLAHVGDSRAYLLRAGSLRRLTEDHTLVTRMVKAGEITEAEAAVHPHRNVLTRVLGTEPDLDLDEQDVGLLEGDRLLLCSDGLTVMVTEDQIQAILETTPSAQEAADRLVRAANRAGGIDNITVVVLDAVGEGGAVGEGSAGSPGGVADTGLAPPSPGAGDAAPATVGSQAPSAGAGGTGPARVMRRRTLRWVVAGVAVLVVLAAGVTGFRAWVDGQWFVGEADGHVAIFQGVPASVLGYRLSHVDVETALPADEVAALPLYAGLADGINANSREDALAIVAQMRTDLRTQRKTDATTQGGGNG
ncbi:MAG: Stp1/IreP family PP2C-type Ser/Thr phosphatase [Planctomycetaceae bacterium]